MTEAEYIIEAFENAFGNSSSKRIALYGLGQNTGTIVNAFKDYNIVCLLDGYKTDGEMYGKPVMSIEQAIDSEIDLIVIVARTNSAKVILRRIEGICRQNNIPVFDVHGKNLIQEADTGSRDNPYFEFNISDIKKAIDEADAVSFDIFDTLLTRQTIAPEDVFELVEVSCDIPGFAKERIKAERDVNRKGVATLSAIYEQLLYSGFFDTDLCQNAREAEIAFEKKLLIPRTDVVKLLDYAVSRHKTVSLISDMYLGRDVIEDILHDNGVTGYQNIFISCDYHVTKAGGLYGVYESEVKAKQYLHIGDDQDGDVEFARMNGIKPLRILKPSDMAEISALKDMLQWPHGLAERIMTGMVISRLFNSPFALYHSSGRPHISSGYDFGYILMGPLMTGFVHWLIAETTGKYDKILFASRDGYLVRNLYLHAIKAMNITDAPRDIYFYTSRMASVSASIVDEEDLTYAASVPYKGSNEELVKHRFYLDDEEISPSEDGEPAGEYCIRHKSAIMKRSAELRSNYLKYIASTDISKNDRIAFFDLVSSGTCQMGTQIILGRNDVRGFYLINVKESYRKKAELSVDAYIEAGLLLQLKSFLSGDYDPVEEITAPRQATLMYFDNNGKPVFGVDERSEEVLSYIESVQSGITGFCDEFSEIIAEKGPADISNTYADRMYSLIGRRFCDVRDCPLDAMEFKDDFTGREFELKNIFD